MKIVGKAIDGTPTVFLGWFCTCPMEQDYVCGHWFVLHTEDCFLGMPTDRPECVKSCSGGWYGTRSHLNTPQQLKRSREQFKGL